MFKRSLGILLMILEKSLDGAVHLPSSMTFPATIQLTAMSKLVDVIFILFPSASNKKFFRIGRLRFSVSILSAIPTAFFKLLFMIINFINTLIVIILN